jgi:hypothetical protein
MLRHVKPLRPGTIRSRSLTSHSSLGRAMSTLRNLSSSPPSSWLFSASSPSPTKASPTPPRRKRWTSDRCRSQPNARIPFRWLRSSASWLWPAEQRCFSPRGAAIRCSRRQAANQPIRKLPLRRFGKVEAAGTPLQLFPFNGAGLVRVNSGSSPHGAASSEEINK